jgi:AraC family transcriptional activator of tynA and feaB
MAMSLRNLNRVFEKHECSVTQWIWQERLALAHRQLVDVGHASRSIGDIALGCGFSTQAHFAREFKQRYGATPTQRRQASTR